MDRSLQFISTVGMSQDDWLAYRINGLGASDISTVMGLNPYKSKVELFHEKIGAPKLTIENIAMFMGKEQENFIAELWQYWAGTPESMIENRRNNRIVRRCQKVNAYVRNPDFPWLYVSLDRKINKHGIRGEGALELKTIAGHEADKWEAGIPPGHILQVQTQILCLRFVYGELAVFKDGRDYYVYPFDEMRDVQQTIVSTCEDFWGRVEKGRILANRKYEANRTFNGRAAAEIQAEIDSIEPPPDGSLAYNNYLKEKYRNPQISEKLGTEEQFQWACSHRQIANQIKELEESKQLEENRLKLSLGDVQTLDFGARGRVNWKKNAAGNRVFTNKIKGV